MLPYLFVIYLTRQFKVNPGMYKQFLKEYELQKIHCNNESFGLQKVKCYFAPH
jgi:hypothetical protein